MIGVFDGLQENKRTGEIKTCAYPAFRGYSLDACYNSYSNKKAHAYNYCMGVMVDLRVQGCKIFDYGITSYSTFQFTFAVVFEFEGLMFVRYETARTTKTYILAGESAIECIR